MVAAVDYLRAAGEIALLRRDFAGHPDDYAQRLAEHLLPVFEADLIEVYEGGGPTATSFMRRATAGGGDPVSEPILALFADIAEGGAPAHGLIGTLSCSAASEAVLERGFRAFLITPIPGRDRSAGVMAVWWRSERVTGPEDAALLVCAANALGVEIERTRGERDQRWKSERISQFLDAVPGLVSYVNRDGVYEFVNRRYEEWIGLPPEKIVGMHLRDVLGEEVYAKVAPHVGKVFQGHRHSWQAELTLRKAGRLHVDIRYEPDIDEFGITHGYFGLVLDVTERVRAEERVRDHDRRLRSIAANFPGIIYRRVQWQDGRVDHPYISEGAREVLGVDKIEPERAEEIFLTLVAPEYREAMAQAIMRSVETMEPLNEQARILKPTGEEAWIHIVARPHLGMQGETVWDGVIIDVTAEREAKLRLEGLLQEKEVLLREVYHRVKNNLQVIISLLNLQASQIRDPLARAHFEQTSNRVHTLGLIHRLLYGSVDLAHVDFRDYVNELARHLISAYAAEPERIKLDLDVESAQIELDRAVPLGLIVCELLSNCLKHAFPDKAAGTVYIGFQRAGDAMELEIRDDGRGFDGVEVRRPGSLGLGIVEALARQLDGKLSIGEGGKGASFTIVLPASALT